MRIVTEKAARALKNREHFKSGNTEVRQFTHDTAFWGLFLHGNCIAMVGAGSLSLYDRGWQTATTKERLNGVLEEFGFLGGIHQKDGQWYYTDKRAIRADMDNDIDKPVAEYVSEWQGMKTIKL